MKKLYTKIIFAGMAVIASYGAVYSQADTAKLESFSLKELLSMKVTTASKTLQELGLTPASMVLVTKEQIKMRGYLSLLDVMYDLPDVKVDDKIYSGIRNSFTVRGTQGSEKFIILLDGIAISSPSGEAMPIMENYPVHLAEQIEVVYGPASALYGANAVSGVINIITKKAIPGKELHAEVSSATSSTGYTNSTLLLTKKLGNEASLIISGQYYYDKQPDYSKLYKDDSLMSISSHTKGIFNTIYGPVTPVTPVTPKYEAPLEAYNIYAALRFQDFSFSYFRNSTRVPTAYGNNTSNAVYNKNVFMEQNVSTANATYKKSLDKLTSTTSFTASEYNLDPQSNYRNLYTAMEPAYKYSTCSMTKIEEQLDYKASRKLAFTSGAGYENYYSIPQSADLDAPVDRKDYIHGSYLGTINHNDPDGLETIFYAIRYYNAGAYLQGQYSPSNKLDITMGARYDYNSRYGGSFNPRLGIVFKPLEKTTVKLLYGSAFLAPSPSDSYVQYGSFDTQDSGKTYHSYFLHLPNPGLKPILSHNAEINIRHYISNNLSVTLDGYYTMLSGLHVFANDNTSTHLYNNQFNGIPVDYVEVFVNQDKQKNYGGSLQLNWKHNAGNIKFNSVLSVSYVNGVIESGDHMIKKAALDFISPVMVHIGTDIKAGRFSLAPRLIIMGEQHIAGFADTTGSVNKRQTIAGYALLNVSARYTSKKGLSFFANVTNALNQHYRSVGFNMDTNNKNTELFYGQPEEPIRLVAGFNVAF